MSGTFGDLKSAVKRELYNRTDLDTEIQASILSAVQFYENEKWWWKEQQDTSLSTVLNQAFILLPDNFDYEDAFTITYTTYPLPMIKRDWETMIRFLISSQTMRGQPTDYAFYEGKIYFYPTPNGAYQLTLWKTRTLTPLSSDSESNEWTTDAEEMIRSRTIADIRCHILRESAALQEMQVMRGMNKDQFSNRELSAYNKLWNKSSIKLSSGHISPHMF